MQQLQKRTCVVVLFGIACGVTIGCSGGPARVRQPAYNSQVGEDAIAAYDGNNDSAINDEELDAVPALRAAVRQIDSDGDGHLTAKEIAARVQDWQDSRIAEMPVRCEVTLDGAPLAGALVVFEPESFLGSNIQPASGTTESSGNVGVTLADEHLADPRYPGVACGWYKIRVTSDDHALPARYNSDTTLGCEVAIDADWVTQGVVLLKLKSS